MIAGIEGMPEVHSTEWWSWAFWARDPASIRDLVIIVGALIGIPFVVWREWLHHRQTRAALQQAESAREQAAIAQARHEAQVEADRKRRITDNFTRAIEQLGSEKLETRLGAIYALEGIAHESPPHHWPITETLLAYVRRRAPWRSESAAEASAQKEKLKPATDVQAALTVIARRQADHDPEEWVMDLDLSGTDLRGALLMDANLACADLEDAHLERACLTSAYLAHARLVNTKLAGTYLQNVYLKGADLEGAQLEDAVLMDAVLDGVDLRSTNITQEQLDDAFSDEDTKVPPHLERREEHPGRARSWE